MAYLRLRRSRTSRYVDGRTQGFRYVIEVLESSGLPLEIFVYQRKPIISGTDYTDVFSNVASPADFEEYPVGAPSCDAYPFFRLKSIDLVFRSMSLADDAWIALQNDIAQLIESLEFMNDLSLEEEVTFGTRPESSSSDSQSSSSSSSSST